MERLNKHLLEIFKQILDDDDNDDVDVDANGDDNWWCKKAIVQGLAWAH